MYIKTYTHRFPYSTINYSNGENTSMVTHVEAVVAEGKIIKIEPCAETKGVYANMCLDCQTIGDEQQQESNRRLNQISMKVRGWGKGMANQLVTGWGKGMLTPV